MEFVRTQLKTIVKVSLTLFILRKIVSFLWEQQRRANLLLKLPGPTLGEEEHFLLGHFGKRGFILQPEDPGLSPEVLKVVQYRVIPGLKRLLFQNKELNEKGIVRLYILNSSFPMNTLAIIFLHKMEYVRQLLSMKEASKFSKGHSYDISTPLIGDSVLHASGEKWAHQRPLIEKAFKHQVLVKMVPKVSETVKEMVHKLKSLNGKEVNIHEEMLKLTVDVIGKVGLNYEFKSVVAKTTNDAPLYNAFNEVIEDLFIRIMNPILNMEAYFPTPRTRNFNHALKKLDDAVDNVIEQRLKERSKLIANHQDNEADYDLLDYLLSACEKGDFEKQLVKDNLKTLLFAGHDTTGAALAWMLYLLAKHPEHVEKIRQELKTVLKDDPTRDPTYDELEKLDYLNACLLETFRLYPSAAFTRNTLEDVDFGDFVVPKGVEIGVVPWLIHRDPANYPDRPEEFVPSRWLPGGSEYQYLGEEKQSNSNRADSLQSKLGRHAMHRPMLPFSLGHRNCVGRPLSFLEMRMAIVAFVRELDFDLCPNDKNFQPEPLMQLTLNPRSIYLVPRVRA